jgi:hypothetical protein
MYAVTNHLAVGPKQELFILILEMSGNQNASTNDRVFCYEYKHYPCKHLNRVDAIYRKNYIVSVKENLEHIKHKRCLTTACTTAWLQCCASKLTGEAARQADQ